MTFIISPNSPNSSHPINGRREGWITMETKKYRILAKKNFEKLLTSGTLTWREDTSTVFVLVNTSTSTSYHISFNGFRKRFSKGCSTGYCQTTE